MNSDNEDDDADGSGVSAADSTHNAKGNGEAEDDGEFGDDFDDFEEGGDGDEDDFGDFDDGFQQGEEHAETTFDKPPDQPSVPVPSPGPVSQRYSILSSLFRKAPPLK